MKRLALLIIAVLVFSSAAIAVEGDQLQPPQQKSMHTNNHNPICGLLMVMCLVVHILVTIWVFQDIRNRGTGSGIWIAIALIAGLLGALVYAVVRLGDVKQP